MTTSKTRHLIFTLPILCAIFCMAPIFTGCGGLPEGAPSQISEVANEAALYDTPGLVFTGGNCLFGAANGNLSIILAPSNTVIIGTLSNSPNTITINGNSTYCGNANVVNVKSMAISVAGGGVGTTESVLISYANGWFATKTVTASSGTTWDTGGQNGGSDADALQIAVPSTGNANIVLGATGVHLMGTGYVDIAFLNSHNPNNFQLALAAGNDTFSALGDAAVGGAATTQITVSGGAGNDNIFTSGGNYNDSYSGGDGNDTIFVAPGVTTGHMTLDGGNGFDTINWSSRTLSVALRIGAGFVSGDTAQPERHSITNTVESLVAGSANDILQGNAAGFNTVLYGGPGNDNFYQAGTTADSNDTLWGGPGIDWVNYSARTCNVGVTLDNNPNDGCIGSGEADDVEYDVENILTGSGSDTITGNNNDNVINAGGGGTTNTIWGLGGDDTFMQDSNATDTISGGIGEDTVSYQNRGAFAITAVLDGNTASGQITGGEADILLTDIENLVGSALAPTNTLTGNGWDNIISGAGATGTNTIDCKGGLDIAVSATTAANCEIVQP